MREAEHIALTLVKIRKDANKTQSECAEAIGVSLRTYQYYEKRGGTIPLASALRFCDFCGAEIGDFAPRILD